MDNIKDVVYQVVGKMSLRQPQTPEKVERILKNILNDKELEHVSLAGEKNGHLFIHVDSPAWLYQMNIKKNKILERLKDEVSSVQNISFKIGKVK